MTVLFHELPTMDGGFTFDDVRRTVRHARRARRRARLRKAVKTVGVAAGLALLGAASYLLTRWSIGFGLYVWVHRG